MVRRLCEGEISSEISFISALNELIQSEVETGNMTFSEAWSMAVNETEELSPKMIKLLSVGWETFSAHAAVTVSFPHCPLPARKRTGSSSTQASSTRQRDGCTGRWEP